MISKLKSRYSAREWAYIKAAYKRTVPFAICFLLFFGGNPLYSLFLGVWSGGDIQKRWFQPLLSALLFLLGTWIFFTPGETAFLYYCAVYLLVSAAGMALGRFLNKCMAA